MTTGNAAIRTLQGGKQSGVTDTPGSPTFIEFVGEPIYPELNNGKTRRDATRLDGEAGTDMQGIKAGSLPLTTYLRGVGVGAVAGESAAGGECEDMLDCYFGMTGQVGVGVASTTSNAVNLIKVASTANFYDETEAGSQIASGMMMLTTSGYQCREVATKVVDTSLAPHLAFASEPANSAIVHPSICWIPDFTNMDHSFMWFAVEGDNWRRELFGCALKLSLVMPEKGPVTMQWSPVANHYSKETYAGDTFAAPSALDTIFTANSPLYLDTTETELISGQIDFGWLVEPRVASGGENGSNGWLYYPDPDGPHFTGMLYDDEDLQDDMDTAGTTFDFTLQLGAALGNAALVRGPNIEFKSAQKQKYRGADALQVDGRFTRPSAGRGSIRLHLFGGPAA